MEKRELPTKKDFIMWLFGVAIVLFLWLPTKVPREFTVENHTQKTITKVNFLYAYGDIFNEVEIPPNSRAVVKMPLPGLGDDYFLDRRRAAPERIHKHDYYNVYIEFSDGTSQEWKDNYLENVFRLTINEQDDDIEADFGNRVWLFEFWDALDAYKSGEVKKRLLN